MHVCLYNLQVLAANKMVVYGNFVDVYVFFYLAPKGKMEKEWQLTNDIISITKE